MIIDDEADITFIFKIILEDAHFIVDVFNDPVEALSFYKKNYYDLVLLDLRLPGLSGFEMYYKILEIDDKAKICFLTSSEQIHLIHKNGKSIPNSVTVIQKPIENSIFVQRVKEISSR